MDKQREAFEKWALSVTDGKFPDFSLEGDEYWQLRTNTAWESWQAAQADKLEFARRVAVDATWCVRNDLPYSLDAIIAKVEQEQ